MTNMPIQPLWFTHFIEILFVLEFQLTKFIVGVFSYKAHFRPQIPLMEGPAERGQSYGLHMTGFKLSLEVLRHK